MKYLITGGAGFIGSHVSDALLKRGDSVIALDNLSTGNQQNLQHLEGSFGFKFIEGSVFDVTLIDKLVESVDHVLHFAAAVGVFTIINKPLESLLTNLHGVENVLGACFRHNKEVLITSSSEIYGKNSSMPLHEESDRIIGSPLKSRWAYSEAKAIDESMAYFYFQEKGLGVRLIRLFNTVGPRQVGQYGMVVPRFVSSALRNEPLTIYGTGSQSRCFCHVYDAVGAILAIIDSSETVGDVFNVGNDQEITIEKLAHTVIELTGSKSIVKKVLYEKAYSPGFEDMHRRIPDLTKIKNIVGWAPRFSLHSIISDVASHMQE